MSRVLLFTLVIGAALEACNSATDVNGQFAVALMTNRTVGSAETPIDVSITIVNHGSHDAETLDPRSYACFAPYAVLDDAGQPVPAPGRSCFAVAYSPVVLAPGDSITIRDRWSADMRDNSAHVVPVPTGQYRIVAHVIGDGRQLSSEPVAVSIVNQDPR